MKRQFLITIDTKNIWEIERKLLDIVEEVNKNGDAEIQTLSVIEEDVITSTLRLVQDKRDKIKKNLNPIKIKELVQQAADSLMKKIHNP